MSAAENPASPADIDEHTFEVLRALAEQNAAEREAALTALERVVGYVRYVGGYMSPEHQATLWHAEALLAEHGRKTR
jgi:hypothetical protein